MVLRYRGGCCGLWARSLGGGISQQSYLIVVKHCPMKSPGLALLAFLACSSCGVQKGYEIAVQASNEFHQRLGAGQDDLIYNQASDRFQQATSRDVVKGYFSRIRRKMGTCGSYEVTKWFVRADVVQGTFATLSYRATCAKGTLDESFQWHIVDGKATLDQYTAQSPLLLVD